MDFSGLYLYHRALFLLHDIFYSKDFAIVSASKYIVTT